MSSSPRLVHRETDRTIATRVDFADSFLARARGLMFRRSVEEGYALVFRFGRPVTRSLHMAFVPFPIDALWLVEGEVQRVARLEAWTGLGRGWADAVIELPAGAGEGIRPGDRIGIDPGDGVQYSPNGTI